MTLLTVYWSQVTDCHCTESSIIQSQMLYTSGPTLWNSIYYWAHIKDVSRYESEKYPVILNQFPEDVYYMYRIILLYSNIKSSSKF